MVAVVHGPPGITLVIEIMVVALAVVMKGS